MATTTASLTLSSGDISSDALSISITQTLYKDGTTIGLDQTTGLNKIILTATTNIVLLDSSAAGVGKAAKVYIANKSTDASEFVTITINAQIVGRLYAGDWMFIPADFHDAAGEIAITANGGTNKICYALFHEGITLVTT